MVHPITVDENFERGVLGVLGRVGSMDKGKKDDGEDGQTRRLDLSLDLHRF